MSSLLAGNVGFLQGKKKCLLSCSLVMKNCSAVSKIPQYDRLLSFDLDRLEEWTNMNYVKLNWT